MLTCEIIRKFTSASVEKFRKIVRKNKIHLRKNRKFTNVSREVQKKIWYAKKFTYEKKGSSVMYSKKFIHSVSNFTRDS